MIRWERLAATAWKAPKFTPAQIKAAQAAVKAMPSSDDDPDHVANLWQQADKYPDISQIDFGDAYQAVWKLADLQASNAHDWLSRAKLLAHMAQPGQSIKNPNPFTAEPIVTLDGDDVIVLDGHNRLGALLLLGATSWQLWTVPVS